MFHHGGCIAGGLALGPPDPGGGGGGAPLPADRELLSPCEGASIHTIPGVAVS